MLRFPFSVKNLLSLSLLIAALWATSGLVWAETPLTEDTPTVAKSAEQRLAQLAETYYEQQALFEPLSATFNGDNRFDDQLPRTLEPSVRTQQLAFWRQVAGQLHGIARDQLSVEQQLSYDVLEYELKTALDLAQFPDWLLPISHMDSVPVVLANFASGQAEQALRTVADYEMYLRRISQLPRWIDQAIRNMREGLRQQVVPSHAIVAAALPQFRQLLSDSAETQAYFVPVKHFPGTFSRQDRKRLSGQYRSAIEKNILPSLRRLETYLRQEYLPASRNSTGWQDLPNGSKWYEAWVRYQTTTAMKPDEIHAIGLQEVARIQHEFIALGPKLGYTGEPNGLPGWIATQDKYRIFKSEAEILDAYRAINAKVIEKLPMLFSRLPKAALEIRPEPEISRLTASDHYSSPAIDGSRPGVFWAVINDPTQYSTTEMTTLFLHEGQPGHHFHLALMQELQLPKFRKFGGNNAFTEGWALYAETLGHEMGLYENDPNAYLGHLTDELLRAARLVVDTGMHAKGWSREKTIAYLQTTLGYDEAAARNATERYMVSPGQALGYKIGSLKIMELRQRATAALESKFDLREFNDAILADGTLPLSLLEAKMNIWIEKSRKP
jgi:uncharacterized protein (DUF885 family)